jgi:hypothetical protein
MEFSKYFMPYSKINMKGKFMRVKEIKNNIKNLSHRDEMSEETLRGKYQRPVGAQH